MHWQALLEVEGPHFFVPSQPGALQICFKVLFVLDPLGACLLRQDTSSAVFLIWTVRYSATIFGVHLRYLNVVRSDSSNSEDLIVLRCL